MALPKPVGKQADVVYLPSHGHQVILGTAGTGKTVMAIHRAAHLADPDTRNHGQTLLLTYNRALVGYLKHLAAEYGNRITIETFGKFSRGYLAGLGRMSQNRIASSFKRQDLIRAAIAEVRTSYQPHDFFDRPLDFFLAELDWIDGFGMQSEEEYIQAERIGRHKALHPNFKPMVWQIRQNYLQRLVASGKTCDWSNIVRLVRNALAEDTRDRLYKHIVIDEGQDFTPEAIRALSEAIPPDGSVTFFGDFAQQIYGSRLSWQSVGLNVTRRETFTDNYRNTAEIARLALAMSDMPHFKDVPDMVAPTSSRAAGALPTLVECINVQHEINIIREGAADLGNFAKVGVLARTREDARRATQGVPGVHELHEDTYSWDVGNGVYAGTYHSGKGLEFDVVMLPFCGEEQMPDPGVVEAFGLDDAMSRESRLLYVGVTRARSELLITYSGKLTPIFPDAESDVWTEASG